MAKEIGEYLVEEENVLGQGSDGTVYLGKCKRSNQQVAVKRINKALLSERAKNHLATEIRVLKTLNHPNIIKLRDAFDDVRTQEIHLVMEHVPGCDLYDYMEQREASLTYNEVRWLMYQVVKAVHYCHQHRIVHHDLCLENLMIFPTKDVDTNIDEEFAAAVEYLPNSLPANAQFCSVKVIDFGFCEEVQPGQLLERFSGSEAYVAPEILDGEPYEGPPTDVWSLGVVLYILLRGRFPFSPTDIEAHYEEATNLEYLLSILIEFDNPREADAYDLLGSMFDSDPKTRITLPEILAHPFFNGMSDVDKSLSEEIIGHPFFSSAQTTTTTTTRRQDD